jgi:cytochrome c oxidase assembly protein subunit 15
LTLAQLVALAATRAPARARRAALSLLVIVLGQGAIGYAQYFLGLPEPLVGVHMLGASLTVAAAAHLMLVTRGQALPVASP